MTAASVALDRISFQCRRMPLTDAMIKMAATTSQDETRRTVRLGRLLIQIPPHDLDWLLKRI